MTNQFAAGLAARLYRLADQLGELRERVREAVATEAGRAVGEAVRDLIVAAIRGRIPLPTTAPFPTHGHRPKHSWGDDPDAWDCEDEEEFDTDIRRPGSLSPPASEPSARQPMWAAALTGATAARWWAARTGRAWIGAGVGVLTAAAAAVGNPVVRADVAVITVVAELVTGALPPVPPAF